MRFANTLLFGALLALGVSAQQLPDSCVDRLLTADALPHQPCCTACKQDFQPGSEERTNCHALCDSYQCGGYPGNCEALEADGQLN